MDQAREIVNSFQTVVDMMRDRQMYSERALQPLVDFRDQQMQGLSMTSRPVFHIDFPSLNLRIIYDMHPKFKVNDIKKLLDFDGTVLLVSREKPGTLALKGLEDAATNVQIFDIQELQYNVAHHVLVPRHVPIRSKDEIEKIMRQVCVKSKYQLPLIQSTDPMARYLALRPDELVRIERLSPAAGEYVSYRCCVK